MRCSSCDVLLEFRGAITICSYMNTSNLFTADVSRHGLDCVLKPCQYCGIPKNSFSHKSGCPSIQADAYHVLWDTWRMETPNYDSMLQWLPNEMVEDVIDLMNKERQTSTHNWDFDGGQ